MRDLINLVENAQRHFVGTCVDSFDEDGDCMVRELPWSTVSDLGYADENAQQISHEQFVQMGGQDMPEAAGHDCRYLLSDDGVLMLYDADDDVHYFFA